MGMIAAFLTTRVFAPLASGLAGALIIVVAVLWTGAKLTDHGLRAEITRAVAARDGAIRELGTCQANEAGLNAALVAQNAAIRALGEQDRTRTASAERALAAARHAAERDRRAAAQLLTAKPSADLCASADALILGSVP